MTTNDTARTGSSRSATTGQPSRIWTPRNLDLVMATAVLLVVSIPVGIANIYLGFMLGESPCILCGLERFGMLLVGAIGVFILRYGPHYKYVVTLLLTSFFFLYTAFRHWGGHIPNDLGQGFGGAMFGVHTYTWAMLIYWLIIAFLAVGMVFVGRDAGLRREFAGETRPVKRLSRYSTVAVVVVLALGVTNAFQFLVTNGPPPFAGMGDPPRFTLDVAQASKYWTTDVYTRLTDPGLHSFAAPTPLLPGEDEAYGLPTDPSTGPVTTLSGELELAGTSELGFEVAGGAAAGLAYDEANDQFGLASTDGGLYFVEDDFSSVVSYALVDAVNGADIQDTVDATFLGAGRLLAMAKNKTLYGAAQVPAGDVDETTAWAEFREDSGDVTGVFELKERPKLRTARAKDAWALSIAADPSTESYYVVSVPHEDKPTIVITQFAADNQISREGILTLEHTGAAPDADAAGYYPVGADFRDGRLYLLSAAYNSLLVIDPQTLSVQDVYALPSLGNMTDVVVRDSTIYVLAHQDGRDVVHELTGLQDT